MSLPKDGNKYELIEGDLLVSPVGNTHSLICIRTSCLLAMFVRRKKLGNVYDSSMGFRLGPRLLLSPDISFVSRARLAEIMVAPDKFLYGAPDLVVEVLSPGDRLKIIEDKLDKYFAHGTRLAWVVDPKHSTLAIHQPDSVTKLANANEVVNGGEVVHGFKFRLGEILFD
jgi:Uma2 family endonuclease